MAQNQPLQKCGAKTRSGVPCRNPPVTGKNRCRMHGGATGSGAQPGNQNALKHGLYSRQERENRSEIDQILNSLNQLTNELKN